MFNTQRRKRNNSKLSALKPPHAMHLVRAAHGIAVAGAADVAADVVGEAGEAGADAAVGAGEAGTATPRPRRRRLPAQRRSARSASARWSLEVRRTQASAGATRRPPSRRRRR